MPPRMTVFKNQGSQDDSDVETTGFEMFKMLGYFKRKWALVISFIASMAGGAIPIVQFQFMGDMSSGMADVMAGQGSAAEAFVPLILKMLYCIIAQIVVMGFSMMLRSYCVPEFALDIRKAIYGALMDQTIAYFDEQQTGVLISRLSEDVTLVRETHVDKTLQIVQGLSQAIAGIVMAFTTSWMVSLVSLVAVPLIIVTFWLGELWVDKLWVVYNETSTTAASKAEEVISQFRTVKAFDAEMKEYNAYAKSLDGIDDVYSTTSLAHATKDAIITFLANAMTTAILYFTSWLVVEKPDMGVEAGDSMILMMSLMMGTMGFTQAFACVEDFRKANISAAKILQITESKPSFSRNAGPDIGQLQGRIEFKNVGFKYATRKEWAVKDLSFTIEAGETVAFVGESGCGKTTTLALLQRFYEIDEGEILIDGKNIKEYSPASVRRNISIVPQSPVLFTMSVKENIAYSKPDATDQEVADAATIGNAHNFIMQLNNNYKEQVQQTSLSGGQKQRICISRAVLANAPILLLDEATAALDTESEQLVQQSLENIRKGKSAILVAHRLATVKNANRIFVFAAGKVIETGSHEELLAKNGAYAELVKFQLQ